LPCNGTRLFSRQKAKVCNQKADVDEDAEEGAKALPTDFFVTYGALFAISVHIFNEL
jgi:hypothetical protein